MITDGPLPRLTGVCATPAYSPARFTVTLQRSPRLIRFRVALAYLGDDPNVDDVHRRRLIVYFVEDPDVARM